LTRDITRASGSNILLVISRPTKERRTSKGLGSAATFLELLCSEVPDVVLSITRGWPIKIWRPPYARLPSIDFSRDILAHQATRLLVLRDSGSGWADLGSPNRVLGLLAENVNPPAWFRQTNYFSP
jgi:hypothetical protein